MIQVSGGFAGINDYSNMSMTPSPFDHDSRSRSSLILYSELPICKTGPYPPSLVPHETFPLVHGFAPNSPLNPTTATIPSSVGPFLFKFIKISRKEKKGIYSQECFIRYPDTSKFVKKKKHSCFASPRAHTYAAVRITLIRSFTCMLTSVVNQFTHRVRQ